MEIRNLISKFITSIFEKNYSTANADLSKILEHKLKNRISNILESSPAQKEAKKKFLDMIKAKKGSSKKGSPKKGVSKKKGKKEEVTEEGFEKKPFDSKGFKKLYSGPATTKPVRGDRQTDKTEEYNKRKDASKKSSKKGNK